MVSYINSGHLIMGKLCISISLSIMVSVMYEIYHNGVVKILCSMSYHIARYSPGDLLLLATD